ncbi:hypothetical protein NFI96_004645, partial [Prochilodus magdalenae]
VMTSLSTPAVQETCAENNETSPEGVRPFPVCQGGSSIICTIVTQPAGKSNFGDGELTTRLCADGGDLPAISALTSVPVSLGHDLAEIRWYAPPRPNCSRQMVFETRLFFHNSTPLQMEALDDISTAALKAANITEDQLAELSRDDIRDLLPGPEHFFRRKAIWLVAHQEECYHSFDRSTSRSKDTEPRTPCSTGPSTSITSKPSPSKVMKMPSLETPTGPPQSRACTGRGVHQHLQPLPESDHGPPPPFRASIIGPVPKEPGISWLMTCHTDGVFMKCLEWLIPT